MLSSLFVLLCVALLSSSINNTGEVIVLLVQLFKIHQLLFSFLIPGALGQITIYPGRTMKIIGTVTGPLKKYVGQS